VKCNITSAGKKQNRGSHAECGLPAGTLAHQQIGTKRRQQDCRLRQRSACFGNGPAETKIVEDRRLYFGTGRQASVMNRMRGGEGIGPAAGDGRRILQAQADDNRPALEKTRRQKIGGIERLIVGNRPVCSRSPEHLHQPPLVRDLDIITARNGHSGRKPVDNRRHTSKCTVAIERYRGYSGSGSP